MKVIRVLFLMGLAATSSFMSAQEQPYALTLAQARDYALQHNKTLLNARDKAVATRALVKGSIAQGLPQVEGGLDYMTYFNYELNFSFGSSGGGNLPDFSQPPYDAGDEQLFYDIMSMMGTSEPIIMTDQFTGSIKVSQLIFSGQYIAGVQIAKIAKMLADQSIVSSELDVKENVTNNYYAILTTEQTLRILSENLDNLNELLRHTTNLYKAGVAEETDVDQLRITVSQLKNTQKSLERMNQLSYNMLKFQLGVPPETKIVLTDNLDLATGTIDSTALAIDYDITNNINYQLMESQVAMNKKQLAMEQWSYSPTVAGFYSYTKKFLTTGFDMTPNNLAGFTMSLPILTSGMRMNKVKQARINLDITERNQEMVKEQLETQKSQLLYNYQNALENYNTQKENVNTAGRVYKSTQNKYRQGIISSFELTQSNSNYLNAESNYLNSLLTLLQAQTSLDKLYNRL